MKVKSNNLIAKRDSLSKTITKNYKIISVENICANSQIRNYNLVKVYEEIKTLAMYRVSIKMFIQAINMGYTSYDEFEKYNSNYYNIFMLSELYEQYVKLGKINTLSKKSKNVNEIFSNSKIRGLRAELKKKILKIQKDIDDFNNKASLTIDDKYSKLFAA